MDMLFFIQIHSSRRWTSKVAEGNHTNLSCKVYWRDDCADENIRPWCYVTG